MKKIYLTDAQIVTLRVLLRDEAERIGYPNIYDEDNKKQWPSRLKRLHTINKKLWRAIYG